MIKAFFKNRRAIYNNFGHEKWICYDRDTFKILREYIKKKKEKINMKERKEFWKIIEGFPDYLISNKGNLKSVKTLKDVKLFTKDDGYVSYTLRLDNKGYYKYIHRLVAEAFVDNPNNKGQVNHINGIKGDNRAENLEWVTPAENIRHAIETGLLKYKKKEKDIKNSKHSKGEDANGSLLNPEKVIKIRVLHETGEYKQVELAEMFGVNHRTINDVIKRRQWKHID